jgi:DNA invertase Pin-like site-specific DNA recombinase
MEHLRPGDTLVCTQLDSLSGSLRGLQDIVREVRAKGAHLKATAQPIDTSSAGEAFFALLDAFAAFDTNTRRERHLEGIGVAKARGAYKGRPRKIDATQIRRLLDEGLGASDVAKQLRIGRASVYRLAGVIRKPPKSDPAGSRSKRRPLTARIDGLVAWLRPDWK